MGDSFGTRLRFLVDSGSGSCLTLRASGVGQPSRWRARRPVKGRGVVLVLVELNVVEQRYQAVLEVLNQGA